MRLSKSAMAFSLDDRNDAAELPARRGGHEQTS